MSNLLKTTICKEQLRLTQKYWWRHRANDLAPKKPTKGKGPIIIAHTAGRWDYHSNYPVWYKGKKYPTNYGILSTPDGRVYKHWHLHSNIAKSGKNINARAKLAYMGNTGYSTGTHTHFEKWIRTLGVWRKVDGLAEILIPDMPPCEDRLRRCRTLTKKLEKQIILQTKYKEMWKKRCTDCILERDQCKIDLKKCKESKGILIPLK